MNLSWPELETSVSFLCTRVQCTTKKDWGKLRRVLNYPKATKDDRWIMRSKYLLKLDTWVDLSHTVHEDIRGHTGGCMSCGVGIIHGKAPK